MSAVKISEEFQIVIPKEIRDKMGLKPGQTLEMFAYRDRIELVPFRNISEYRGFAKGIDTRVDREEDRDI